MVTKQNKYILTFIVLLMISFIVILEVSILSSQTEARTNVSALETTGVPVEQGMFLRSSKALDYVEIQDIPSSRELIEYYHNRAYDGAPPRIPHALLDGDDHIGAKSCLQCHQNGGYVDQFKAFAPVTPHPDYLNCRQCHVPTKTNRLFVKSDFVRKEAPNTHQSALKGSPPIIPHSLQLRENCLACHAGPSASKEIRVSHPERVNCRQCHAQSNIDPVVFSRLIKKQD
ncbi:MAG: hypothetical protein JXR07_02400 [Reichenbachiella sp.]